MIKKKLLSGSSICTDRRILTLMKVINGIVLENYETELIKSTNSIDKVSTKYHSKSRNLRAFKSSSAYLVYKSSTINILKQFHNHIDRWSTFNPLYSFIKTHAKNKIFSEKACCHLIFNSTQIFQASKAA